MVSWDGAELFYRAWLPNEKSEKVLLLFHRGHEHSGRWQETADSLGLDDVAFFAWDARGHGRSPAKRGAARELTDVIRDVDAFVREISRRYQIKLENMIVLAHSLAAVTVGAWVHDYAPPIRGLILATAALRGKTLCSPRRPGPSCATEVFRRRRSEELRPAEHAHARPDRSGPLSIRPTHFSRDRSQSPARSPRHRAAIGGGCRCDPGADPDAGGGTGLCR